MARMIDARRLLPLALAWSAAGCLADLRPPELIEVGVTRASARAGRAQLERAAETQGLQAWRATCATELYFDQFETVRGIQAPKRITILSDLNPDFAERHLHQFLSADHLGMTKDPAFVDNLLYLLLEDPR